MARPSPHLVPALVALLLLAGAQANFVELTRVFGSAVRSNYALLCKRADDEAQALVFSSLSPSARDTAGRSNATVHCVARVLPHLNRNCSHLNATQFARYAQPLLDRCVRRPPLSAPDAADARAFSFDTASCRSKVAFSSNDVESSVAFVCECAQSSFYEVTPGWARYILEGRESDTAAELLAMRSCAAEAELQMSELCLRKPGDYDVLALQLLQACCKRVRVASPIKLDCAAVVPRDLRPIKFEF